ncbi:MAG: spore coat associated protein CotJA [Tissierellia bacterium]|nr:spore coat associated protein CotJA [Tissierellia bacterium]
MDRDYYEDMRPCCPGALARACVPIQEMKHVFSPREALKAGTLFPELVNTKFTTGVSDWERRCRYNG